MLTDSGGFQVFSLAEKRAITRRGWPSSRTSTAPSTCSPERSVQIQEALGAD